MDAQLGPPRDGGGGFLSDAFDSSLTDNETDEDGLVGGDETEESSSSPQVHNLSSIFMVLSLAPALLSYVS